MLWCSWKIILKFETYTRYSGVVGEDPKKKILGVFNDSFLSNLVKGAITFIMEAYWKKLENLAVDIMSKVYIGVHRIFYFAIWGAQILFSLTNTALHYSIIEKTHQQSQLTF